MRPSEAARPSNPAPVLRVEHLSMRFGGLVAVNDFSFRARRGDITALIGPSGAGKSTVLALLCRFHDATAGAVRWQGRDIRTIGLRDTYAKARG